MKNKKKLDIEQIQPELGSQFQCVADRCALSCCVGWNVPLDKDTFRRYKKDAKLAQHVSKELYGVSRSSQQFGSIKKTPDGKCSMLTPEGLCSVQTSLGEGALSKICGTFPRANYHYQNLNVRTFTNACPEVARLAVSSKEAMSLVAQKDTKKDKCKQSVFLRGLFSDCRKNLFFALYNFFYSSTLPMWKKIVAARSVISSIDESTILSEGHFSAILFEKQLELSQAELDLDPAVLQLESLIPSIVEKSLLNDDKIPLTQLKINGMADEESGLDKELTEKQLLDLYIKKRGLLFRKSNFNEDWVWTNLLLSGLLGNIDNFNTKKSHALVALDGLVLRLALTKFVFICTSTPNNFNDPAFLGLVSAIVTRRTRDDILKQNKSLTTIRAKYGDTGAIMPLLVA